MEWIQAGDPSRETIIFIHGLVGNYRGFKREISYFSKQYHVVSYNLPGHGKMDRGTPQQFTMDRLLEQLSEVYAAAGVERAHLCTLSFGSYVGNMYAALYPDKVISLAHIGAHYNNPSELFDVFHHYWDRREEDYPSWLREYSSAIYPRGRHWLNPYAKVSDEIYYRLGQQIHPHIIREALRIRLETDLKSKLRMIQQPVLWTMGSFDDLYRSCLYDLHQVVPQAVYMRIPRAGHAANLFRPRYFRRIYREFLSGFELKPGDSGHPFFALFRSIRKLIR